MEKLTFKLEQFEGPLDLLLHLISKHKLNLYDIQIDLLLEQYLAQMEQIPFADLEQASDFLEMASRLVYMKSAMLLPKYEDEGENLKRELTGQLLEKQGSKAQDTEKANARPREEYLKYVGTYHILGEGGKRDAKTGIQHGSCEGIGV